MVVEAAHTAVAVAGIAVVVVRIATAAVVASTVVVVTPFVAASTDALPFSLVVVVVRCVASLLPSTVSSSFSPRCFSVLRRPRPLERVPPRRNRQTKRPYVSILALSVFLEEEPPSRL